MKRRAYAYFVLNESFLGESLRRKFARCRTNPPHKHSARQYIRLGDDGRFEVLDEAATHLPLVVNTDQRQRAWALLPEPPTSFGYRQGQDLVRPALRSSDTYAKWIKECRRLHVVVDTEDGKLRKADGLPRVLGGAN